MQKNEGCSLIISKTSYIFESIRNNISCSFPRLGYFVPLGDCSVVLSKADLSQTFFFAMTMLVLKFVNVEKQDVLVNRVAQVTLYSDTVFVIVTELAYSNIGSTALDQWFIVTRRNVMICSLWSRSRLLTATLNPPDLDHWFNVTRRNVMICPAFRIKFLPLHKERVWPIWVVANVVREKVGPDFKAPQNNSYVRMSSFNSFMARSCHVYN